MSILNEDKKGRKFLFDNEHSVSFSRKTFNLII